MDAPPDVTALLGELDVGSDKAVTELVVSLYSELRRLASSYLRRERSDHTLQTTALVHEAYLPHLSAGARRTGQGLDGSRLQREGSGRGEKSS